MRSDEVQGSFSASSPGAFIRRNTVGETVSLPVSSNLFKINGLGLHLQGQCHIYLKYWLSVVPGYVVLLFTFKLAEKASSAGQPKTE